VSAALRAAGQLAAVGVNKAADYYVPAGEMVGPASPRTADVVDGDDMPSVRRRPLRAGGEEHRRPKPTGERLRQLGVELDAA
jgi:hypothetical protein